MKGLILSSGHHASAPSPTPAPSSSCRSRTSPSCSTGSRRSSAPAFVTSALSSATRRRRFGPRSAMDRAGARRLPTSSRTPPCDLAHAVLISEPFIGRDPFVVYLGDNLLNRASRNSSSASSASNVKPRRSCWPGCRIRRCSAWPSSRAIASCASSKSPKCRRATSPSWASISFGRVFESVKRIRPSFRNELEITDAIQDLIDRSLEVRPHIVEGWWKDTGKLEDMLEANRLILLFTLDRRRQGDR